VTNRTPERYSMCVSVDPISGKPYVESYLDEGGAWMLAPYPEWVEVRRGSDVVGYFLRGNTAFRIVRKLSGSGQNRAVTWNLHGRGIGTDDLLESFPNSDDAKRRLLALVKGLVPK